MTHLNRSLALPSLLVRTLSAGVQHGLDQNFLVLARFDPDCPHPYSPLTRISSLLMARRGLDRTILSQVSNRNISGYKEFSFIESILLGNDNYFQIIYFFIVEYIFFHFM
jgi:hypothetical protein